jgi:hypothetical protein
MFKRKLILLTLLVLTACPSIKTQTIVPTNVKYVPCDVLAFISYDSEVDTKLTVDEIRAYNEKYRKLCI